MAKEYIFKLDYALYNEETGEAVFKPKVVCELIRCGECANETCSKIHKDMPNWFCADGKRKEKDNG